MSQLILGGGEEASRRTYKKSSVLENLSVVEVALEELKLNLIHQKKGPNWKGLCFNHTESKPSFYLKTRENKFVCYGCGIVGGPFILLFSQSSMPLEYLRQKFGLGNESNSRIKTLVEEELIRFRGTESYLYFDTKNYLPHI